MQNFDEFGKAFGCKVGPADDPDEQLPGLVNLQHDRGEPGLRPGLRILRLPRIRAAGCFLFADSLPRKWRKVALLLQLAEDSYP